MVNGLMSLKLFNQYLIQNCERTYIDMEDMIGTLQTKSYHFSRMKKNTFSNLVRDGNARSVICFIGQFL
jgi:hypothetical protein